MNLRDLSPFKTNTVCFEEFVESRQHVADIGAAIRDEGMEGQAGHVYLDAFYILDDTCNEYDGDYLLVIENYSAAGNDLRPLERQLHDWYCNNF
jgi:hypothetical protein